MEVIDTMMVNMTKHIDKFLAEKSIAKAIIVNPLQICINPDAIPILVQISMTIPRMTPKNPLNPHVVW